MVGWLLGAAINLVGSVMINLGTNVMKLGHNKRAMLDLPEEEKPAVSRFKEWQIGTVVFIVGNVANFVSFGFAAQSLLAALGSVQFVSNVFFASFVLKEKVTMLVIIATTCIIGGCMLLVLFGNHSSEDYTVEELLALYRAPPYIVYLVMMFVFVMGSYILYLHGKHVANQKGREQSLWVTILPVTYSIFSALLGTQSVLFSKSLSVLLRTTFSGHNMLGNWYTWVTLICFLITAGFWVTRLNKGLRLFPAMIIVPLMQICWTLFSIVSGMIYFKEYVSFNPSTAKHGPLNAIMFCLGVSIVFCGVFLLTKSGSSKQQEYEDLDEQVQADQLEMVNNPAFEASPGGGKAAAAGEVPDPDVPQRDKLNMDTLRFTSLASSTAANIKAIGRAQRARLGQTMSPGRGNFNSTQGSSRVPGSPGMDGAASEAGMPSLSGTAHMMGTLKKGAKKISHNLRKDFNVDLDELKQIIGMGQGGYMPALSLFAMPAVDLTASRRARQAKPDGLAGRHSAMLSALPSSRFFGAQEGEGGLEETRSEARHAHPAETAQGRNTPTNAAAGDKAASESSYYPAVPVHAPASSPAAASSTPAAAPAAAPTPSTAAAAASAAPAAAPVSSSGAVPPPTAPTAGVDVSLALPAGTLLLPVLPPEQPGGPYRVPSPVISAGGARPPTMSHGGGVPSPQGSVLLAGPAGSMCMAPAPASSSPDMRHMQAIVRGAAARHLLGHTPQPVSAAPMLSPLSLSPGSSPRTGGVPSPARRSRAASPLLGHAASSGLGGGFGAGDAGSERLLVSPSFLRSDAELLDPVLAATARGRRITDPSVLQGYVVPTGSVPLPLGCPAGMALPPAQPLPADSLLPLPSLHGLAYQAVSPPTLVPSAGGSAAPAGSLWHPGLRPGMPHSASFHDLPQPHAHMGPGAMFQLQQLPTAWAAPGQALMQDVGLPGGLLSHAGYDMPSQGPAAGLPPHHQQAAWAAPAGQQQHYPGHSYTAGLLASDPRSSWHMMGAVPSYPPAATAQQPAGSGGWYAPQQHTPQLGAASPDSRAWPAHSVSFRHASSYGGAAASGLVQHDSRAWDGPVAPGGMPAAGLRPTSPQLGGAAVSRSLSRRGPYPGGAGYGGLEGPPTPHTHRQWS